MTSFAISWLVAFVFTQCVEMGVYVHAHEASAQRPVSEKIAIAFACSAITHPLVWFVIPDLSRAAGIAHWWTTVAICEAFAVIAEGILLTSFRVRHAFVWALAANTCSFVMGLFGYLRLDW